MSAHERGLGRGLDALFRNVPSVNVEVAMDTTPATGVKTAAPEITTLPIAALCPGQGQPRKHFDEAALDELAASIRSQGVVQPLLVRPHRTDTATIYEIVAGERRWRAAQRAGLTEVPVYLRELSDDDALTVALIENLQREDLNALEEAQAIQTLRERLPLSQEELAVRLGKSRSAVANALRLLQLPQTMQEALRDGQFTPGHARAILALPELELQEALFTAIMERHLSVRDAESAVVYWKRNGTLPVAVCTGTPPAHKSSRTEKPESIKLVIRQLRETVHPKATIAGTDRMGRITLPYESEEQLAGILQRLGLAVTVETASTEPEQVEQTEHAEQVEQAAHQDEPDAMLVDVSRETYDAPLSTQAEEAQQMDAPLSEVNAFETGLEH
ncbi:MAG: ParB/RepB/Spo0J family partition protein [Bilophila sp.]